MALAKEFGELLRQLRMDARLTQAQLADAAGIGPKTVGNLEQGVNKTAHGYTASQLADALHLTGATREEFLGLAAGRVRVTIRMGEQEASSESSSIGNEEPGL